MVSLCDLIATHPDLNFKRTAETLRKRYDEHRTKLSRLIDDTAYGPARVKGREGIDYTQVEKAFERFGIPPGPPHLDRSIERMVENFGYSKVLKAVENAKTK